MALISSKVVDWLIDWLYSNGKCVCDFLLVINSNPGPTNLGQFQRYCRFPVDISDLTPNPPEFWGVALGLDRRCWGSQERLEWAGNRAPLPASVILIASHCSALNCVPLLIFFLQSPLIFVLEQKCIVLPVVSLVVFCDWSFRKYVWRWWRGVYVWWWRRVRLGNLHNLRVHIFSLLRCAVLCVSSMWSNDTPVSIY